MKIKKEIKNKEWIFYLLAFLLPTIIVCTAMYIQSIFPFGDKTVLLWDLEIQYWKYYAWLHDLMHGDVGLFYSFSQALGGNMYATAASHVLFCPFNWLVYFFDTAHLAEFFSIITILKLAACGLTFYIFGVKRFNMANKGLLLLFSTAYALMEYNVSLCSNIHFIDAIYTLPIMALGIYQLVNHGKKTLLYWSTFYILAVNWYTAYMLCLFSVFYCLFELFLRFRSKKDWKLCLRTFFSYCITMLLAACSSAVVLIPGLLASTQGKGHFELQYLVPQFHCDPLYILRSLFITSEGNIDYNQPAIYVSSLVLVFVLMMYLDKRFDKRKKTACFLLSLFLFVSFSFVPLEIIWTILKKTYSFHFRYSFLFSFLLIVSACFYLEELERKKYTLSWKLCLGAASGIGLYFLIQNLVEPFRGESIIYYYIGLFFCFAGSLYFILGGRIKNHAARKMILAFISIILIGEQIYNVKYTFSKYGISNEKFINYVTNTDKAITEIKDSHKDDAFRMEKTFSEMTERRNPLVPAASEGLTFSYHGISYYHSIYNAKVNDFLSYTGYCKLDAMATNYVDTNLVMDTLLGIRYVLTDDAPSVYQKSYLENLPEGISVYENGKALSFGTVIDSKASDFPWSEDNNSFANQQKLIQMISGNQEAEKILVRQNYEERYEQGKRIWSITAVSDGPIYCYWKAGHADSSVYVNGVFRQPYFSRFYKNVIYLGEYKAGDTIVVSINDPENCAQDHGFEAYAVDLPLYHAVIDELRDNALEKVMIKGSTVSGKISTAKDGVLWLSVPYDKGWEIRLNGKKVDYKQILNCFIGVDIDAGDYELSMKYIPPYVRGSLMVSFISLVIFVAWNRKCRHKVKANHY